MEELTLADASALIVLAGDLNQLDANTVAERTRLTPLVKVPTRGDNILDMLFESEPSYSNIKIVTSVVKTDHKAIIATADQTVTNQTNNQLRLSSESAVPFSTPAY